MGVGADTEHCPLIPQGQGEQGEGVGGQRGGGGGHAVMPLSPSRHHGRPRHLNNAMQSTCELWIALVSSFSVFHT